jgi:hypothetical protein
MASEQFVIVHGWRYWCGYKTKPRIYRSRPRLHWSRDAADAIQFARRTDAERSLPVVRTLQFQAKVVCLTV